MITWSLRKQELTWMIELMFPRKNIWMKEWHGLMSAMRLTKFHSLWSRCSHRWVRSFSCCTWDSLLTTTPTCCKAAEIVHFGNKKMPFSQCFVSMFNILFHYRVNSMIVSFLTQCMLWKIIYLAISYTFSWN